jgi:hypothetical protein
MYWRHVNMSLEHINMSLELDAMSWKSPTVSIEPLSMSR